MGDTFKKGAIVFGALLLLLSIWAENPRAAILVAVIVALIFVFGLIWKAIERNKDEISSAAGKLFKVVFVHVGITAVVAVPLFMARSGHDFVQYFDAFVICFVGVAVISALGHFIWFVLF